ncbi:MAG TPA: hypothetical protein ENK39_06155 [Epsilonproteobacteria bacterium]|nr:hypothetical protein [Campylobacterota bacterium]
MKKLILLVLTTTYIMAGMDGWSQDETEAEKAAKMEKERLCNVYTKKVDTYKKTMRNDELAQATLANYVRLQGKYCEDIQKDQNTSK